MANLPPVSVICMMGFAGVIQSANAGTAGELADEIENDAVRIFIGNADGSGMKRLVDLPEFKYQGAVDWSADGRKIGFDAYRPERGETYLQSQIIIADADGQNVRVLGDGAMPSFSPKGQRLAYSRYGKGVWTLDVDHPESPELIDEAGWGTDWSPDGSQIAYTKGSNLVLYDVVEQTSVTLFADDNTGLRQIYWNFAWSPNSQKIAFTAIKDDSHPVLGVVDVRGTAHDLTLLDIQVGTGVDWNVDSNEVLVWMSDQVFSLKPVTPIQLTRLANQPSGYGMSSPALSHDGQRLAVSLFRRGKK